jgi:hypothetical protein
MRTAGRASRLRPAALAARARPVALAAPARPAPLGAGRIALLAVAAVAAALGVAAFLRADSSPGPADAGIVPLPISSGNGIATGFAVAGGRVVTVAHVLAGPVTVAGRRVRVVRVDRRDDLALLSGAGAAASPVTAGAANGEHLRVVRLRAGRPSSLSVHVRRSIVAHVRAPGAVQARVRPVLELSVAGRGGGKVVPGDSGAAVVTDSGELAGIVFATSRNRGGIAYAVDARRLQPLLR